MLFDRAGSPAQKNNSTHGFKNSNIWGSIWGQIYFFRAMLLPDPAHPPKDGGRHCFLYAALRVCGPFGPKIAGMRQRDPFSSADKEASDRSYREYINVQKAKELFEEVMSTPRGRELIAVILDITQMNTSSFSTNALQMGFNEGRRSVGLAISALIDLDAFQQMVKESYDRRIKQQRG